MLCPVYFSSKINIEVYFQNIFGKRVGSDLTIADNVSSVRKHGRSMDI